MRKNQNQQQNQQQNQRQQQQNQQNQNPNAMQEEFGNETDVNEVKKQVQQAEMNKKKASGPIANNYENGSR